MDYVQERAGHKPAVYLSPPNILLHFLYYKGASALFQDACCIMSAHFSEYFAVTHRDQTFFFKRCRSLHNTFPVTKAFVFPEA